MIQLIPRLLLPPWYEATNDAPDRVSVYFRQRSHREIWHAIFAMKTATKTTLEGLQFVDLSSHTRTATWQAQPGEDCVLPEDVEWKKGAFRMHESLWIDGFDTELYSLAARIKLPGVYDGHWRSRRLPDDPKKGAEMVLARTEALKAYRKAQDAREAEEKKARAYREALQGAFGKRASISHSGEVDFSPPLTPTQAKAIVALLKVTP